jgi:hypothetical protein
MKGAKELVGDELMLRQDATALEPFGDRRSSRPLRPTLPLSTGVV